MTGPDARVAHARTPWTCAWAPLVLVAVVDEWPVPLTRRPAESSLAGMRGTAVVAGSVLGFAMMSHPASAQRVQTLDARGSHVDVHGGVITWARRVGASSFFVRRIAGHTSPIPGTRSGLNLFGADLGVDRARRLVLVYGVCRNGTCRGPLVADVRRGGERRLRVPVRRGCEPGVTASVWRDRIAYALRCRAGGSGVYLARSGRSRRLLGLSYDGAKHPSLDLSSEHVVIAGRVFSIAEQICEVRFAEPARARYATSAVAAEGARLWWIRERVEDFGGGDSELLTAALGPRCRLRRLGEPRPLADVLPSQPPFVDSLAVAGNRFYVATLNDGVLSGRLPEALSSIASPVPASPS